MSKLCAITFSWKKEGEFTTDGLAVVRQLVSAAARKTRGVRTKLRDLQNLWKKVAWAILAVDDTQVIGRIVNSVRRRAAQ